jgi:hypothetical protein
MGHMLGARLEGRVVKTRNVHIELTTFKRRISAILPALLRMGK